MSGFDRDEIAREIADMFPSPTLEPGEVTVQDMAKAWRMSAKQAYSKLEYLVQSGKMKKRTLSSLKNAYRVAE